MTALIKAMVLKYIQQLDCVCERRVSVRERERCGG